MIQRIQTLYLLFATIVSAIIVYFFYTWLVFSIKLPTGYVPTIIDNTFNDGIYIYVIALLSVSALVSFITVFLFKKRPIQLKLCKLNILVNILLLGVFCYYLSLTLSGGSSLLKKDILVIISSLSSILFLFLANRAIKRDDDLVKSVDRLR
ncbi:MAG: DUF4293 domain-containing protein [Tenacibaculum sp.]|nr:DUF4293 domain-containing protein [Tenacibaculum sp.]